MVTVTTLGEGCDSQNQSLLLDLQMLVKLLKMLDISSFTLHLLFCVNLWVRFYLAVYVDMLTICEMTSHAIMQG